MPFISDTVGKYDKVTVTSPGEGLKKRQASLQLACTAEGNTIKPDIVFRGKGQISKAERKAYDPDVDYFFQKVNIISSCAPVFFE